MEETILNITETSVIKEINDMEGEGGTVDDGFEGEVPGEGLEAWEDGEVQQVTTALHDADVMTYRCIVV